MLLHTYIYRVIGKLEYICKSNNSRNNVGKKVKIDTHAWNDMGVLLQPQKKFKKWPTDGASCDKKSNN